MAATDQDWLAQQLKAHEQPLPDNGFSRQVLSRLAAAEIQKAPAPQGIKRNHRMILILALLAGVLVALAGLSDIDLDTVLLASKAEVLSFAGFTLSGLGLWILAGWTLTLTGCGWSLAFTR